jgi:Coenzyme PQQ synthesis protein D (PqqD)
MIKTEKISLESMIVQNSGNIASDMDGEKVLMNIKNSKYYNLGKLGGVIWDLIESPTQVTKLISTLMSEYEVEQNECERQVMNFLDLLYKENLIHTELKFKKYSPF